MAKWAGSDPGLVGVLSAEAGPAGHQDYCAFCNEPYDEKNLAICRQCDRQFCSRCGDVAKNICFHCQRQ